MEFERFHYKSLNEIKADLTRLGVTLPLSEDYAVLRTPVSFGGLTSANRFAIQPMEGCDGTADGSPDTLTLERYDRFARSGAGLIWEEATAIVPEGRANPRQLWLHEGNLDAYKRLVERMKTLCMQENGFEPVIILQATHSGRYSKPAGKPAPVIAYNNPIFEEKAPIDPSRIISDEALDALVPCYGKTAHLAQEAGFDGVDIKACHRYLMSELMSAYTRPGRYGGCYENRTRLYREAIAAARAATKGFLVTSRLNVYDGFPYPYGVGTAEGQGITPVLEDSLRLVRELAEGGFSLLDVTIGNPYFNPHVNRPFDQGGYIPPEHPLEGVARMFDCIRQVKAAAPGLTLISSGHSYLRQFAPALAAGTVAAGVSHMAGLGRMAFAYPDFVRDLLQKGEIDPKKVCLACGKCTELMRAGSTAGCAVRNPVYTDIYRRDVLKK